MNQSFRIPKRIPTSLIVMHMLLVALVAFAMVAGLPVSSLHG